ncbi:MAG: DNA polymerase thumb domain-containing protein [Bacillota bacterium]
MPDIKRLRREIAIIDLKSFYASVECVDRGLDPFKTPLIVADESRGGGSIVLAVSPYLKKAGIPSRLRLHEMPDVKGLIIAKPRMQRYLDVSTDIVGIYLDHVAPEDLHIYSIDEAFLDLSEYLEYYGMSTAELVTMIRNKVLKKTGIPSTAGIGDNLLLSKLALDLESKKAPSGMAEWRHEDVETKLWPVRPLSEMWGIGHRMERRLNGLGMYTVGDIAKGRRETLVRHFGVLGDELYHHAHGIDGSIIKEGIKERPTQQKSVGLSQVLFKDYDETMIAPVLREMSDEACEKLRFIAKEARTVHLHIGYSATEGGGGFSRQMRLDDASDHPDTIHEAVMKLFHRFYEGALIRKVGIRLTSLRDREPAIQLSFFENRLKKAEERALFDAMDDIHRRFGKTSALRLTSYEDSARTKERAGLIGGHRG